MKDLDTYQKLAMSTRLPAYKPDAALFGLLSEAGEIAAVFQKMIRGDYNEEVALTKLKAELGDVLWGIAAVATDNGWKLSEIGLENLEKLAARKKAGTLKGDGDDR